MAGILSMFGRLFARANKKLNEPQHNRIPSSMFFPIIDVEKLKRKHNIEKTARERGASGLPDPNAFSVDDIETAVISDILNEEARSFGEFDAWMKQSAIDIADVRTRLSDKKVLEIADTAAKFYEAEATSGLNFMAKSKENVPLSRRGLDQFRADHNLHRAADYETNKWSGRVTALVFVFAEVAANTLFLGQGSELGYVGGFIESLLIACVNVGLAYFIIWRCVQAANHRRIGVRALGYLGVLIFSLLIFAVNLLGAHYRDAMVEFGQLAAQGLSPPVPPSRQAVISFFAEPFAIAELMSWFMLVVGCMFAFVTALQRYRLTDSYPGYERADRAHQKAYDDYSQRYAHHVGALEQQLRIFNRGMTSERDYMSSLAREREEKAANRAAVVRQFKTHRENLERAANELLNLYRQANKQARPPGIGVPEYFSKPWAMPERELPPLELASATTEEINRLISELQLVIDEQKARVSSKYDDCLSRFAEIDRIIRMNSEAR